jgi:bifunctional N-acetylglucosamine-1-phosphate-uridyltransferase/glucosamine-1-phosphate-acetyltransferase GlmU-like protein
MRELMNIRSKATIVCTQMEEPHGYGRIIQYRIVEEKDCSEEERLVKMVNCGIYAFENGFLCEKLPKITNNNAQQEYYLTSIFSGEDEVKIFEIPAEKQYEVCGINTPEQLEDMRSKTV